MATDWHWLDPSALDTSIAPRYLCIPRWRTIQIAVYGDGRLLHAPKAA